MFRKEGKNRSSTLIIRFHLLQFSLQDNGSAKYFQGAMHTSNMGEKVAQVSHDFRKEIPMGFLSRSSAGRIEFGKPWKRIIEKLG